MPNPYEIDVLERLWETESITHEQATGQTIQHHAARIAEIRELRAQASKDRLRVTELEAEVRSLQQTVAAMRRQFERRLLTLEGK